MTEQTARLQELIGLTSHLPNWEFDDYGDNDNDSSYWGIKSTDKDGMFCRFLTSESNRNVGRLIVEMRNAMESYFALEKRCEAMEKVVEAAAKSIGLMCKSGNHAEGCKMCAVSVALLDLKGE